MKRSGGQGGRTAKNRWFALLFFFPMKTTWLGDFGAAGDRKATHIYGVPAINTL